MRGFAIVVVSTVLWSTGANAQWVHTAGKEDPFKKGNREHFALATSTTGEMTGFRCSSKEDLTFLLVTHEKPKAEDLARLSAVRPNLLVIVDNGEKVALPSRIDSTPNGEKLRFVADGDGVAAVARAAAGARSRFALAVEFMGKVLSSRVFGVSGSSRAIGTLVQGCKL